MRLLRFLAVGILFGIVMTKSEAVSWFRIQEMFRFQSIHMYGIIGIAVIIGVITHQVIKKKNIKAVHGEPIYIEGKPTQPYANIFGGICFGIGWAMTGACPGPLYVLFGHGNLIILVTIISAVIGAFVYGAMRNKLPH